MAATSRSCTIEEESIGQCNHENHSFEELRHQQLTLERHVKQLQEVDFKELENQLKHLQQRCLDEADIHFLQSLKTWWNEGPKRAADSEDVEAPKEPLSDEETRTQQSDTEAEESATGKEMPESQTSSSQSFVARLPEDTYSFFALGNPWSKSFICATLVLACQALIYFFLLGRAGEEEKQQGNPLNLPVNVSSGVRACQVLAILIAVANEDSIIGSIYTRSIFWNSSSFLRMLEGSLAIVVTFVLILQAETARDVLLNFTAVRFVSQMDNVVFTFAFLGYFGSEMQRDAVSTKEKEAKVTETGKSVSRSLAWMILIVILLAWLWISWKQGRGGFLCHRIFVQFGDDELPELASFSGVYTIKAPETWGGRVEYTEDPHVIINGENGARNYNPAKIGYCPSERAWVFVHGSSMDPDFCSEWSARSPITDSYDVTSTVFLGSRWFVKVGRQEVRMKHFHLSCHDCNKINRDFCGTNGLCIANKCVCDHGFYGSQCEHTAPCDSLVTDAQFDDLPDEHSSSFRMVENLWFYNRPVYRGNSILDVPTLNPNKGQLIVVFTGRRWEMTLPLPAIEFLDDNAAFSKMSDFHALWSTHTPFYVSEPSDVDTLSATLPVHIDWFERVGTSLEDAKFRLVCRILNDDNIQATVSLWMKGGKEKERAEKSYEEIELWNTSQVTDMSEIFKGADANPDVSSWDTSQVVKFVGMFHGAQSFNRPISSWDVSDAIDMSKMFESASAFNQPLSDWVTSLVENMSRMFFKAQSFDQDISQWNTSKVKDMSYLFSYTDSFNQNLSTWNTSSVENMGYMFESATSFNHDISTWITSSVTTMIRMFQGAIAFNQDLSSWNTSSVIDMGFMFRESPFNRDISTWDTSAVKEVDGMFWRATYFDQDISSWNVSSANTMRAMFSEATSFNQDLGSWNVSRVKDMGYMFEQASSFDQDVSRWDVSSVEDMAAMFAEASSFNQDLSSWNVSLVKDMSHLFSYTNTFNQNLSTWNTSSVQNMGYMFESATSFNHDISAWDTSSVATMIRMFQEAAAFNHDLSAWNTSSVIDMRYMFKKSPFNRDISTWDTSAVKEMDGMFLQASHFDQDISSWNVSSANSMRALFSEATSFNQGIGSWKVSKVKDMAYMFEQTSSFDQDLSSWNVSSVEIMVAMFAEASLFNQDISSWNVSLVKDMSYMFKNATSFNQSLCWTSLHPRVKVEGMFCGSQGRFNPYCVDMVVLNKSESGC